MEDVEFQAAWYEYMQAEREFTEAYRAAQSCRTGSPEDYAMWSISGYADAAESAMMSIGPSE